MLSGFYARDGHKLAGNVIAAVVLSVIRDRGEELSCHLVSSISNPSWLEYMGWHDHLWVEPLTPENGMLALPNRPGHGMAFKPELFSEFPYPDGD